jgi:hypothetical protein
MGLNNRAIREADVFKDQSAIEANISSPLAPECNRPANIRISRFVDIAASASCMI